jgi:hypothetical protein
VPILCILQEKPVLTVKFLYFRRYFLQDLVFDISFVSGHTSLGVHNGTQTQCHVEFVLSFTAVYTGIRPVSVPSLKKNQLNHSICCPLPGGLKTCELRVMDGGKSPVCED